MQGPNPQLLTRIDCLPDLAPGPDYRRSTLHADSRIWLEKNCYVDIWIEVLHALQLDPVAAMGFTLALDFEGDQFTFYKPVHRELSQLYGLDVAELNVWRPLIDHAREHLSAGRLLSTEADAFWLPDTQGTDYRRQHTKTTIVLAALDSAGERASYFHNAGFHQLDGEDFRGIFGRDTTGDPQVMPLFAELIRIDRIQRLPSPALAAQALELLRFNLTRRPSDNPVTRFAARFAADLPDIQRRGLDYFHLWAFSTIRQLGSAFELAALHLDWLSSHGLADLAEAARDCEQLASQAKSLILKGARAAHSGKPLDTPALCQPMAQAWDRVMARLDAV